MHTSARSFFDPDHARAAYHAANVEIMPVGRAQFESHAYHAKMDNVWVTLSDEISPTVKHKTYASERSFVTFLAEPGAEIVSGGLVMQAPTLIWHGRGRKYFERSSGPSRRAGMSLPVEEMVAAGAALAGRDLTTPTNSLSITPAPQAMSRLRNLLANVVAMTRGIAPMPAHPEAERALEQSLIQSLVGCLDIETSETSLSNQHSETIMRRFYRMLDMNPDRPVYVAELCEAIRVPERTLRQCCQLHIGISPHQYLTQRRMHLARRALQAATPDQATVTEIAMRFGFWHLGRFATTYKLIFGQSPSDTLHRL